MMIVHVYVMIMDIFTSMYSLAVSLSLSFDGAMTKTIGKPSGLVKRSGSGTLGGLLGGWLRGGILGVISAPSLGFTYCVGLFSFMMFDINTFLVLVTDTLLLW